MPIDQTSEAEVNFRNAIASGAVHRTGILPPCKKINESIFKVYTRKWLVLRLWSLGSCRSRCQFFYKIPDPERIEVIGRIKDCSNVFDVISK